MRKACGYPLVNSVELVNGKTIIYPQLTYCYLGIRSPFQCLLNQPGFISKCEEWRTSIVDPNLYTDVYSGKVWKEFLCYNGQQFLSQPYNFALMMNMDFFQSSYKHVNYSIGAVYLSILNLPRTLRYKQENVILVSLIPGPHEPKHGINSIDLNVSSVSGSHTILL